MAINSLRVTELTEFLDYEKHDRMSFHSGNSRNGSYLRTLHTEYGDLAIQIPRDCNGEFNQLEDYNQCFATRCRIGFNEARAKLVERFEQLHEPTN